MTPSGLASLCAYLASAVALTGPRARCGVASTRMAVVNPLAREVTCKVAFWCPTGQPLLASLEAPHEALQPRYRGDVLTLSVGGGSRVGLVDFVAEALGTVRGFRLRLALHALEGTSASHRATLWQQADAVIFVTSGDPAQLDDARAAWHLLRADFAPAAPPPVTFQLGKGGVSADTLRQHLGLVAEPIVEADATETLRRVGDQLLAKLRAGADVV